MYHSRQSITHTTSQRDHYPQNTDTGSDRTGALSVEVQVCMCVYVWFWMGELVPMELVVCVCVCVFV